MSTEGITEKLPGRDELLGRLHLPQGRRRSGDELVAALGAFGAGVIVGAGLALLFAPKPGRQLRRELGEKVERTRSSGDGESRAPMQEAGA